MIQPAKSSTAAAKRLPPQSKPFPLLHVASGQFISRFTEKSDLHSEKYQNDYYLTVLNLT
jgi:hypothetical protein